MGPSGFVRTTHEFPSKICSQVRVTWVEGYGQQGGRDRWPTFGVLLPTGSSRGEKCATAVVWPQSGESRRTHCLSSAPKAGTEQQTSEPIGATI